MSMRHVARVLATFAGLALISSASVAAAASHTPAPAAAALDSFPNAPDVILWPPHPCIETQVTLYVRGYVATPCDSFLAAYRTGDREIVVRTLAHADFRCAVAPSEFFAVPISFGQLPAGPTTIVIRRNMLSRSGGTIDRLRHHRRTKCRVRDELVQLRPDPPRCTRDPTHHQPGAECSKRE